MPVTKGDAAIGARAPLGSIARTEIVLSSELVTNKNFSAGSTVREDGPLPTPTENGEPRIACNVPAPGATE